MNKKKKVFITGVSGRIGSQLATKLLQSGYEVWGLSRSRQSLKNKKIKIIEADILASDKYQEIMLSCDYVYHLAVYQNIFDKTYQEFNRVNVEGTKKILEILTKNKKIKLIYVSTIMVLTDKVDGNFYVQSKKEATELVKKTNLNWVIVYPKTVINKKEKEGSWWQRILTGGIPGGFRFRLGDKKRIFEFVWIEDLIQDLLKAMESRSGVEIISGKEKMEAEEYLKYMYQLRGKKYIPWRLPFIDSV